MFNEFQRHNIIFVSNRIVFLSWDILSIKLRKQTLETPTCTKKKTSKEYDTIGISTNHTTLHILCVELKKQILNIIKL